MSDLELDPATLSLLTSLDSLSAPGYKAVVKSVFGLLSRDPKHLGNDSSISSLHSSESGGAAAVNDAHGGLLTLVTELARCNCSPDQLQQLLEDASLTDPDRVALAVAAYTQCKDGIRETLRNTGDFGDKKMVGFDWRLDYRVRSSGAGENTSVFLCKFRLMDQKGVESSEEMECDMAQMKDLLYRLNQGVKAAETVEERAGAKKKR
ncbi:hypothetical protein TeGR_g11026 [Tetraparma gracilis]|jgi:hypothetical protein|uniref:COMM domain-containing protein 3 n=1 Tax=Tetraparma gracilis TaxID=2962635 RepID=A0ABQ6MN21_9STRA|nr:hypothetical protein TeGR_g11026 [Tetraparma gracilis]